MTSNAVFWLKFLRDSDLSIDNHTILRYSAMLADRFATIEELLAVDENELIKLGITNQLDRIHLIKQARLFDDKENLPLIRQSASKVHDYWLTHNQSTPLNPKSKCNLSPSLLSRISFNDHSQSDELINLNKKCHFEHIIETPERFVSIDVNEKLKSCQKKTPASAHGMRTVKSISDTISLQKKIIVGTDRLKRLALTKSLFKRQTSIITKKVSNITNKFMNPFGKIKTSNPRITIDDIKITPCQLVIDNPIKSSQDIDERRQMQVLSLNNNIRRSTDWQEGKQIAHTLPNIKRFKLGVPTTFVTRTLANHGHLE